MAPVGAPPINASTHSASINTPIHPPGLAQPMDSPPVDDTSVRADEAVLSGVDTDAHFSLSGLETLRTFIPDNLFPDNILVYDPSNLTNLSDSLVRYVRIFPQASRESGTASPEPATCSNRSSSDYPARVGYLYLKEENKLGQGNHSSAYSAPFRLQLEAGSHEVSAVRVAVKIALAQCGAHEMLRREAVAYNAFPRHLMEDRYVSGPSPPDLCSAIAGASDGAPHPTSDLKDAACPTSTLDNAGDRCTTASPQEVCEATTAPCSDGVAPRDTSDDASADGAGKPAHPATHQPAVVLKFFGYYAPVDVDARIVEHSHPSCDIDSACDTKWPTRLLIMEECGKPIKPDEHTQEQKTSCVQLVKRLHAAGFIQGSMYMRNVLVQPGPLSAPPEERSIDTPSFRIIDFGRVQTRADFSPGNGASFEQMMDEEED